jgi:ABC-2 type transport system ATP-binding protein
MPSASNVSQQDGNGAVVVEVRDLHKWYRMPGHRADTLKGRAVEGFRKGDWHELKVLEGISFDIRRGEFFGVVGRNGSGKSTLLKLLASIYGADSGTIRVAGRVAPIIELGVGFQPELTARENVILNGMMLGLTEKEAAQRFEAVIDFAELHDFVDLKLKNYSSGMQVRLAFATMLQADPDVLLLDEVLSVGDPPFQRKCEEAFRRLKAEGGKTVILVTNQMPMIERFCDRAMLLEGGKIARFGSPREVAEDYTGLVARTEDRSNGGDPAQYRDDSQPEDQKARFVQLQLAGEGTQRTATLDPGEEIRFEATVEASEEVLRPGLQFQIRDGSNTSVVFFPTTVELEETRNILADKRVVIEAAIENKLAPGSYWLSCLLTEVRGGDQTAASNVASIKFRVRESGTQTYGLVTLGHEVHAAAVSEDRP